MKIFQNRIKHSVVLAIRSRRLSILIWWYNKNAPTAITYWSIPDALAFIASVSFLHLTLLAPIFN